MNKAFIPYTPHIEIDKEEMLGRSLQFYQWANKRRTVREISNQPIPKEVIENILLTAGTAPSGANKQPWTFCVVSNPLLKEEIRKAAEAEEYKSYTERMSKEWKEDLEPLKTNWEKPFLTQAPYIIVVFKRIYEIEENKKHQNYYVQESVGLACGLLLAAIHSAGLVSVTYTPSPMNFLLKIFNRPENERPFMIIPVGFANKKAKIPNIKRKKINDIAIFYE
ncbi:MAG: nitroreductase family protein [Flavobacteriales bacterium]|nr:nitroreductase family protein [Flavobacteriales bacterium]